jgi:hypothetical protein
MTHLLAEAFEAAARLPAADQDALAAALLAELRSERDIDAAIESRPAALDQLANEALDELRDGRTRPLDPETLG